MIGLHGYIYIYINWICPVRGFSPICGKSSGGFNIFK